MLHAISNDANDSWGDDDTREIYTGAEFDGVGKDKDDDGLNLAAEEQDQTQLLPSGSHMDAENISLHLPSHLGRSWCDNNAAEDLAKAELHLQEGQLNDSLHQICIALGHKSYIFRNDVRPAHTQRLKTCAWGEVHAIESTVQHHARVYNGARQSIVDLGAEASLLNQYKVLRHQDLKTDTTVIAPNVHGQQNKSLPWFWSMDVRRDADVGAWMYDCKHILFHARPDRQLTHEFKCSLPSALAEGKSSKGVVDQRASVSPS